MLNRICSTPLSIKKTKNIFILGSVDASIKILDVDRMLAKSQIESMAGNKTVDPGSHPVIRTLYDHVEVILCKLWSLNSWFRQMKPLEKIMAGS